jgi:demethylmenaquinone methyltransferase/2-methoxy-6-polyprenyl-1,4-benzoquinol methylase
MFDAIAPRYDLLNRVLSFGQDLKWRRALVDSVSDPRYARILDVATGTGDILMALANGRFGERFCVGMDMAGEMLELAHEKLMRGGVGSACALARCDAESVPLEDSSFDAATIAFGIRNVSDVAKALGEVHRALRPGGRLAVLEFGLPSRRIPRRLYLFYFRHVLPLLGGLISGDYHAYRYLNRSVESFPYGKAFCDVMSASGFDNVIARPLTYGIAVLYFGERAHA